MTRFTGFCICFFCLISSTFAMSSQPPPEECPQPRFTGKAPEPDYSFKNPLEASEENLTTGQTYYEGKTKGPGCVKCHGIKGEGNGPLASQYKPRPRNFACAETVNEIPDGQLFWIIKNGSAGTAMPDHPFYTDEDIWQIVLYLRKLANP